jgi:hypothetical protein
MAKPIETKGSVRSVVRKDGKAEATLVITVPADVAGDIPMGEVKVTILEMQNRMFDPPKERVRGDRG